MAKEKKKLAPIKDPAPAKAAKKSAAAIVNEAMKVIGEEPLSAKQANLIDAKVSV